MLLSNNVNNYLSEKCWVGHSELREMGKDSSCLNPEVQSREFERADWDGRKARKCSRMNVATSHRGVAQPGSAPALGADRPTPTAPFSTLTSLCFQ
jgi:hypothetical protein